MVAYESCYHNRDSGNQSAPLSDMPKTLTGEVTFRDVSLYPDNKK